MKPTVVLQTDFGHGGGGVLQGIIRQTDPAIPVYDYNHLIEPYSIRAASESLENIVPYWPAGTIFVSVVDPGVGTKRRSCVAQLANGSYVVTPDNGALTGIYDEIVAVREIDESINRLPGSEECYIFHGRDVYSYTAGRLAAGVIDFEGVGPEYPVEQCVRFTMTNIETELGEYFARGGITGFDEPFGAARIRIGNLDFQNIVGFKYGDTVRICIKEGERVIFDAPVLYERTFGYVKIGEPLLCGDVGLGDKQFLRFSINEVNFIDLYAPELRKNMGRAASYEVTITASA